MINQTIDMKRDPLNPMVFIAMYVPRIDLAVTPRYQICLKYPKRIPEHLRGFLEDYHQTLYLPIGSKIDLEA